MAPSNFKGVVGMMNLLWTMFTEIFGSLRLLRPLEMTSILIVTMLFCSPTTVATVLAIGAKLGIVAHVRSKEKET